MSTQIDPLTGLPMVFDNIIEQIPLDAQIFPYADLGATARPTAPPLYPDSIIPVSAFLSGQHPDTGSAQTVATNGNHDLRVHVTNAASGGGATPLPTDAFTNSQVLTQSGPQGNKTFHNAYNLSSKIYGFTGAIKYDPLGNDETAAMRIYLENPLTFDDIFLWMGFSQDWSGIAQNPVHMNFQVFYPQPIDLLPLTNGASTNWDCLVRDAAESYLIFLKVHGV